MRTLPARVIRPMQSMQVNKSGGDSIYATSPHKLLEVGNTRTIMMNQLLTTIRVNSVTVIRIEYRRGVLGMEEVGVWQEDGGRGGRTR